jgi:hypothetical protein
MKIVKYFLFLVDTASKEWVSHSQKKRKLLAIQEEDKFNFKILDCIVDELASLFPKYTREIIVSALKGTSMDIEKTYIYLSDPINNKSLLFNEAEDHVILNLKDSNDFKNLQKEKGVEVTQIREDFLKN